MSGSFEGLDVLAWVREGQERSDAEVARAAGFPVARLRELEGGETRPTLEELEGWLAALKMRVVDLGLLLELREELAATEPRALATVVESGEAAFRDFADGAVRLFVGSTRRGLQRAEQGEEGGQSR